MEYFYHEVINKNYEADIWHPFEVSVVVPEREFPEHKYRIYGFRYNQYFEGSGGVF